MPATRKRAGMSAAEDGQARKTLVALYEAAVAAAHPDLCLPPHLPSVPKAGRLIVVGAGKAAAAMALVMEAHYRRLGSLDRVFGFTTAPYDTVTALPIRPEVIEAVQASAISSLSCCPAAHRPCGPRPWQASI